jgi:very-short-patch-repair endonuclease
MKPLNHAEVLLWQQIKEIHGNVRWAKEYKFHPDRRWKADFAIWDKEHDRKWIIEIEGAVFTQGRHTRGTGFIADCEKYNHAALLGYRVLRFPTKQVLDGSAIAFIRRVLDA